MKDKKYPLKEEFDYYGKARISIDYSQEKPKIKFEAPENSERSKAASIILIILYTASFFALSFYALEFFGTKGHITDITNKYTFYPDSKNSTSVNTTVYFSDGINISYSSYFYANRFSLWGFKSDTVDGYMSLYHEPYKIVIIFIICFIPAIILYLFFRKNIHSNTTKFKPAFWMQFKPESLVQDSSNGKWMAKLNIFENDVVEFDTEGEFDDYLEGIKINEYPVYEIKRKKETDKKSYKFWHAEFIFSQKPKIGWIKMRFK